MKKLLICLTVLFSTFLFANSVSAATISGKNVNKVEFSIDENVIYETLKNNGLDVSNYNYIIINQPFSSESWFIIYLFNDNFTFLDVDNSNKVTKNHRTAPAGINYTVVKYYYNNTIGFIQNTTSTGNLYDSLTNMQYYVQNGEFLLFLSSTAYTIAYSNYNMNIGSVYGAVYNNYLTLPEPEPTTYNINLHLNGGSSWDTNEKCNDIGCYIVGNQYEDYTITVPGDNLISYLSNVYITKEPMQFVGWYYDEKLTQKVEATDTIDSDKHFYAKYQYKNVEDFLNNTTFNSYTFDENYQYAVISLNNQQNRDIYLGLDIFATNLEVYKYNKINLSYVQGSTLCLTPIFSKNDKYYYQVSDSLDNDYEVLILEKEKLKGNYNFLLSDNAYITYTNDLKNVVIKDETGNDITTDIEDSYDYSQDNLLNSENDLLEIFKDLINNKDNNVFSYFNQVWNIMKTNKLFTYFMTLIIGALIILIIKSASR